MPTTTPSSSDDERAASASEAQSGGGGHPVRAAVLIALVVFGSVALLVYAVFKLSVRPDVERPPAQPPASSSSR